MANRLIGAFDRVEFQRRIVRWLISANLPFRTVEHPYLRDIFSYLNSSVDIQQANLSEKTVHALVVREFERHKDAVARTLQESPGLVHLIFDGWTSRNRLSLYGVSAVFRDEESTPHKIVLGLPEMNDRHTGENVAEAVLDVIRDYGIEEKIGYFTVDNATVNDAALKVIGWKLGFPWEERRVRCFGHIINLVVRALLFGVEFDAFEQEVSAGLLTIQHEHEQWRKKGPVGKLHNFCQEVNRSDLWTKKLISAQEQRIREAHEGDDIKKHRPVGVVTDNATRWLSQYFMMERALQLQPFYETFLFEARLYVDSQLRTATGTLKKGAKEPLFLREENKLTLNDWEVIALLKEILLDFELVVKALQGDGRPREKARISGDEPISLVQGASWDLLDGYEFLLESLERAKARVEDLVDGEHIAINVNNAWMKLDKYYGKIGESPLIYAATALHPRHRWDRFEAWRDHHADWIEPAKLQVQELWRRQYRDLPVDQKEDLEPPTKIPRLSSNRFAIFRSQERSRASSAVSSTSPSPFPSPAPVEMDEFERWQLEESDSDRYEEDPRAYWHKRRTTYPRLARMALDLHTVLPMSAEVERLFSVTGHMVTPLRNRLQANTIAFCQILRSWYDAGLIGDLDPILSWKTQEPEEKDD